MKLLAAAAVQFSSVTRPDTDPYTRMVPPHIVMFFGSTNEPPLVTYKSPKSIA